MTTQVSIKDKIDILEREYKADYNIHSLLMGLDDYLLLKEELGIDLDSNFNKYKGYEIVIDTENESTKSRFISKSF